MGLGFSGVLVGSCDSDGGSFVDQAASILDRSDPSEAVRWAAARVEFDLGLRVFEEEAAGGGAVVALRDGYPGWAVVTVDVARGGFEATRADDEHASPRRWERASVAGWLAGSPPSALVLVQPWDRS